MSLKKDKQKVLGEFFDDERIKTFLHYDASDQQDIGFHLLERAYRGMISENFATFVQFFIAAGHDINARNPQGNTFLQTINNHKQASDYINILSNAGAQ